ncbi:E3 ubiquitin-protein ligase RNF183 [Megalops cyprinoides]|uniref:E3 ubiquitin-protein ligase RNF183 n=1 Tax=Megalops cyprinoides TaxID=118141 RepID=UPI001864C6A2|nr:E3 ubiquitin-protein ligase RNF183 [Megalops cyprinoides]XP_036395353.1 E3 ubiquitin-protein ligase RNF183 [Megalops cyprinoides]
MSDDRERQSGDGRQSSKPKQPPSDKHKADGKGKTSNGPGRAREREKKERGGREGSIRVAGRSRSSDAERRGREAGRRREHERNRGERRERGRSEEGRKQQRDGGSRDSQEHEDDIEDTECVVCFCSYDNVFKTPKILSCGHTFCLECLARINVSSPEIKSLPCPVCRELTDLPHGRDLPHLDNNEDVFRKLPPEMQRAQSVRFKRSKGKLVLKKPPPGTPSSPTKPSLILPSFKKKEQEVQQSEVGDLQLGTLEYGHAPATSLDVGRPPSRVRGRLRRLFRSDQCYYAVVASIITVTVALMLVGILAFVVVPNVVSHGGNRPFPGNNDSIPGDEDEGPQP